MVCLTVLQQGCLNKHPTGQHLINSEKMCLGAKPQQDLRVLVVGAPPAGTGQFSSWRLGYSSPQTRETFESHSLQQWGDYQHLSCWICWFSKKEGRRDSQRDVYATVTCDTDIQFTFIFCFFGFNKQFYWQYTSQQCTSSFFVFQSLFI